jgi:Flp pilus assembly protein TadG
MMTSSRDVSKDMKLMRFDKDNKGQTLVETALVLILLLLILIGIAEYSRAWYRKSSIKNAVRQGARVAAVTAHITSASAAPCGVTCPAAAPDPDNNNDGVIVAVVCCSSGLVNEPATSVTIAVTDASGNPRAGDAQAGDAVNVSSTSPFSTIVPKLFGSLIPTQLTSDATMRYE